MKAKEMFEQLGFKQYNGSDNFITYYIEKNEEIEIRLCFDKKYKGFIAYDSFGHCTWIELEWFNAIQKQIEELHWYE